LRLICFLVQSLFRKLTNLLRNQVFGKRDLCRSNKKYDWNYVREQIASLLWCVHRLSKQKLQPSQSSEFNQLWIEIKQLLIFTGRLCTLSEAVYYELSAISSNDTPACHLFHLTVELWFNCLALYDCHRFQIQPSEAAQLLKDGHLAGDLLSQAANIILADQITLAAIKFKNEFTGLTIKFINPFACECVKVLLIQTRHLLEQNSSFANGAECGSEMHPFWTSCNRILDETLGISKQNEGQETTRHFRLVCRTVEMPVEDQNLCRLWITNNLAHIFSYDKTYEKVGKEDVQPISMNSQAFSQPIYRADSAANQTNNLPYTVKLLQAIVKQEDAKEEPNLNRIMIAMRLCFTFIQHWPPTVDLILPFLDFFVKRLSVALGPTSVEGMRMLPKNGFTWAQQIRQKSHFLAQGEFAGEVPLPLFFSLIYELVSRLQSKGNQMQFQKLKGRLYSKLQPKKLEELKEIGLYNLMSLFLTLVHSSGSGWTDLIDKFADLVRHSKSRLVHQARMSLMVKATFAFLHLVPIDTDATKVTTLLTSLFNDLADLLPSWVPDNLQLSMAHNVCASLIAQYCDELLVFLESPEYKTRLPSYLPQAYGVRFDSVVHKLNDREVGHMLQFLLSTLKHLHIVVDVDFDDNSESCSSLYKLLYLNFISFIKSEFNSRSGSNQTPDVAFHLTYLSLML
jgi:hypothetical protein